MIVFVCAWDLIFLVAFGKRGGEEDGVRNGKESNGGCVVHCSIDIALINHFLKSFLARRSNQSALSYQTRTLEFKSIITNIAVETQE